VQLGETAQKIKELGGELKQKMDQINAGQLDSTSIEILQQIDLLEQIKAAREIEAAAVRKELASIVEQYKAIYNEGEALGALGLHSELMNEYNVWATKAFDYMGGLNKLMEDLSSDIDTIRIAHTQALISRDKPPDALEFARLEARMAQMARQHEALQQQMAQLAASQQQVAAGADAEEGIIRQP
jgi:hypothetical protein